MTFFSGISGRCPTIQLPMKKPILETWISAGFVNSVSLYLATILSSSRLFTHHLPASTIQQCAPVVEWLPPTRTGVALTPTTAFQRTQSQKHWLLKTHTEAFLGNSNLSGLLSQESASHDASEAVVQARSILALGEINNMRDARSSRTTAWPVVAMAVGEGGHVLQISSIRAVKWTWDRFWFPAGELESKFHGSWIGDGSPITQIKFVTKPKQFDSMRWVVVQKETSTTIFEPELRAKPTTRKASILDRQTATVEHIAVKPVVTLTTASTGGQAHCDFAINLGSEEEAPQLAIVDNCGNWFIWLLDRGGQGKHRKTKAVLKSKGSWDPPLSTRPRGIGDLSTKAYSIAWVDKLRSTSDWIRDESSLGGTDHASTGVLRNAFLSCLEPSSDSYNGLVICNTTYLQALSAVDDKLTTWLDFTRRDRADAILSIQPFPGSRSHLFVLTTDAVHLLDVGVAEEHDARPPSILISCRHYRNARRENLKLSITRLNSVEGEAASLVVLHSTQNRRLDLFSFAVSTENGAAHFFHQRLHLPPSEAKNQGGNTGVESLVAIPLHLRPDSKRSGVHDINPSNIHFFQIFGLTAELSLFSTIVAHSPGTLGTMPSLTKSLGAGWSEDRRSRFLRNKTLRQYEQAFVIADADNEDHQLRVTTPLEAAPRPKTLELRHYLSKLVEEINRGFFGVADRDGAADETHGLFSPIYSAAQHPVEGLHISLRPVLGFSNWWHPFSLAKMDEQWERDLKQLRKCQDVEVFDCGNQFSRLRLMDLFEKLSIDWSAKLPADGLKAMQWRYMELALERMTAEIYLSARGVYVAPQATRDLAAKAAPAEKGKVDDTYSFDELPFSQSGSQRAFSTPRTTPSNPRATSEAFNDESRSQTDEESGQEDPAVARLRMYLPSIKFTPPPRSGPSRVISLWPEQRDVDPTEYKYLPPGTGADTQAESVRRSREKQEERRKRRAERRAQLGLKMEDAAESFSPLPPPFSIHSSPPPAEVRSSQVHSQGFGFGNESQSQSFGFGGFSQTMSQPLAGEFGNRQAKLKRKIKAKKTSGFK